MRSRITLNINKKTIEKAKRYAKINNINLSEIVENYLNSIVDKNFNKYDIEISPFIKSLTTGKKINKNINYKSEYHKYISKKYN